MNEQPVTTPSKDTANNRRWSLKSFTAVRRSLRFFFYTLLSAGCLFLSILLLLRFVFLPQLDAHLPQFTQFASQQLGISLRIAHLESEWHSWRPIITLRQVTLLDQQQRPALELPKIEIRFAWEWLLAGQLRLASVALESPTLQLLRETDGKIYVAGIPLQSGAGDDRLAYWLLEQPLILIKHGAISWEDRLRATPSLALRDVNFLLKNQGNIHSFGLEATPPRDLANPITIRGDIQGERTRRWQDWQGTLFAHVDHADLARWHTWFPVLFRLEKAYGGMRAWLRFRGTSIEQISADLKLSSVTTQLAAHLPLLELSSVSGQLTWMQEPRESRLLTRQLKLIGSHGLQLSPGDIRIHWYPPHAQQLAHGQFQAEALDIAGIGRLLGFMPVDPSIRQFMARFSPQGKIPQLRATWQGNWQNPVHYQLQAQFDNVGLRPTQQTDMGAWGLSGQLTATENQGSVTLASRDTQIALPKIFRQPLHFDTLKLQLAWQRQAQRWQVQLPYADFANEDTAGSAKGHYRYEGKGAGVIDLQAKLSRGRAQGVPRYIPLMLGKSARDWLDQAFPKGYGTDAQLRLRGDLSKFPFNRPQDGEFSVIAHVKDVSLRYAEHYPLIHHIDAELRFLGKRMEILAQRGEVFGVKIGRTRAIIPDLETAEEQLLVEGEARGKTSAMLNFIENSPIRDITSGFIDHLTTQGEGQLKLALQLPLRHLDKTQVKGEYRLLNNELNFGANLPLLRKANGTLLFDNQGIKIENATAHVLGGETTLSANTLTNGVIRLNANGKATAEGLQQTWPTPLGTYLQGTTTWRAVLAIRRRGAEVSIDAPLQGMSLNLPPPLAKNSQDVWNLRLELRPLSDGRARWFANLGKIASAHVLLTPEGNIERGMLAFGKAASLPAEPYLMLSGQLAQLDLDAWRQLLEKMPTTTAQSNENFKTALPSLQTVELNVGKLRLLERDWQQVKLQAQPLPQQAWRANIQAKEVDGEVEWRPQQGQGGHIQARLQRLSWINSRTPSQQLQQLRLKAEQNYPSLDLKIQNLAWQGRALGRLQLQTRRREDGGWDVVSSSLENSDGTLKLAGDWRPVLDSALIRLRFEAKLNNAGAWASRLGDNKLLRSGKLSLEGRLGWQGELLAPQRDTLEGVVGIDLNTGQITQLDPGLGRLLGLLSLQSLPRRLALDFRDVVGEGFAFDQLHGNVRIEEGIAHLENMRINSSVAQISITGETNLARETQQFRIKVVPSVGESLSLGAAVALNPTIGITSLLLQKLLRNPVNHALAFEYQVSGSWNAPVYTKITQPTEPK